MSSMRESLRNIPKWLLKEALFFIDKSRDYAQDNLNIKIDDVIYSTQHSGESTRGHTNFDTKRIIIFVVNVWQEAVRYPRFKHRLFLHKVIRVTLHECYHVYQIGCNYNEHLRYFDGLMSEVETLKFLHGIEQEAIQFSKNNFANAKKYIQQLERSEDITKTIKSKYIRFH